MNLDKKNLDSSLDRLLGLFNTPSADQLDASREHMHRRFNREGIPAAEARLAERLHPRHGWRFVVAGAAAAILVAAVVPFVIRRDRTTGISAAVESSETEIYRVSNNAKEPLSQGTPIDIGDIVSSNGKNGAVVSLRDGSKVEMRSETEFSVERAADGVRLNLRKGSLIVNASKQPAGHLYVQTKDLTVSVVGTVFMVNAEEEGSHVAVIEGEVLVQQGQATKNLLSGEQLLTGLLPESRPLVEEVAWSRSAAAHVALLQQTAAPAATARKRLEFEVAVVRPISGEKNLEEAGKSLGAMAAPGHFFGDSAELRCKAIDGAWSSQDRNVMANASSIPLGRCLGMTSLSGFLRVLREVDHPGASGTDITKISKELERAPDGGPVWYLLNAKAEDPGKATKADLLEMLKNFTFDRLKLKYHLETRIVDGWAVRIAPGGLKMKETSLDAEKRLSDVGQGGSTAHRTTIQKFFSAMAPTSGLILHGPVIDMTGLTGKVFEFNWSPKIVPPLPGAGTGARGAVGGASIPVPDYNPPLEKQLEEQLGLTIEKAKVPTQLIVLDHIEKPSEN